MIGLLKDAFLKTFHICTSQCCVQVIGLLKDAFFKAGLELYLAPYGVLPTGFECGVIEVVPEANSRSALG